VAAAAFALLGLVGMIVLKNASATHLAAVGLISALMAPVLEEVVNRPDPKTLHRLEEIQKRSFISAMIYNYCVNRNRRTSR
jgi:hypothetical protein